MKLHKVVRVSLLFIVCAALMQLWVGMRFYFDETRAQAELWLSAQPEIIAAVGSAINFDLKKRIRVQATQERPAYSLYTFILSGSEGRATVDVVYENEGYEIKSIESQLMGSG